MTRLSWNDLKPRSTPTWLATLSATSLFYVLMSFSLYIENSYYNLFGILVAVLLAILAGLFGGVALTGIMKMIRNKSIQ